MHNPRTIHDDAVLAGIKAKPCGWPPASLDPGCGRRQIGLYPRGRSTKFRSLRFQGIARWASATDERT